MIKIIELFDLPGAVRECRSYGNGHINDTYKIVCESGERFIFQRLNTAVFADPEGVMGNIRLITEYLTANAADDMKILHLIPTKTGEYYYADSTGFWRIFEYIDHADEREVVGNVNDLYSCGFAFGSFQSMLINFNASLLCNTIPDFHNTPKRFDDFIAAYHNDTCGRASSVKDEADFIISRRDFYSILEDEHAAGRLPLRVTHNDTKINNVLLSPGDHRPLCIVDLDTIMPGFSVNDFGDSIRSGANTAAEDEHDISKVKLDLDLFDAYTHGFCDGCKDTLTAAETRLFATASIMMTLECAMRFLTDYLSGDTYFKTNYADQNLARCRAQLALAADMERKRDEMEGIVKKYTEEKYNV